MEYGKLFNRSASLVWENKFLILLGILAALGGGSTSSFRASGDGSGTGQPGQFPQFDGEVSGVAVGAIIALICVALVIGVALWVISTIARGGLIAGVNSIESGGKSSFSQAWSAAWKKVWTLLGIGLLPALPGLILSVLGLVGLAAYGGVFALFGEELADPFGASGLGIVVVLLLCIVAPIALVLAILRNFAERAAMLENLGVVDSYRRGWNVLMGNLGEAIILFVLQVVIAIVLGIALFVPGIILALCCFLWPLLFIVQGFVSAFVSALWTLAWRGWTGKQPPLVEKEPVIV